MGQLFEDKVVWITGGGSGIGRSLALEFAREGAMVAVSGRRKDKLEEVVRDVEAVGGRAIGVTCNVTDEADVKRAADEVVTALGKLDVAVANAGFSVAGKIESLSAADWRRQLDTNVVGLAVTARHALPHLRKTAGRLVLVGSVASMVATPKVGAYSASKFAVRAIGQTLAAELHGSGVTCTTIHPGFVESEISQVDNDGNFRPEFQDRRPKNLMWSSEKAAQVMVRAIAKRKREYVFTGHGKIGAFLGRHMPGVVHFFVTRGKADGYRRKQEA
jgi:NAD(P)-dependent dehydrogenase (short-subunit alcohol dehydrogenase family)